MKTAILQFIADEANCAVSQVQLDNTLEEDLGLDSLHMTSLQMSVEDEIGQAIDDDEWFRCRIVQDVITLAGSQLATH